MATKVKNLSELKKLLEAKIKPKIDVALDKYVAPAVKDVMQSMVHIKVYQEYTPKYYRRKKENGGLADISNMKHSVKHGELIVRNTRDDTVRYDVGSFKKGDHRDVAYVVEYGVGYMYNPPKYNATDKDGKTYRRPRRFTQATREELQQSDAHITALKQGLKRQGLEVK